MGLTGSIGATGLQGTAGASGTTGATGAAGSTGSQGVIGLTGGVGATGSKGDAGSIGATGIAGVSGLPGDTGLQGTIGATGQQGPSGTLAFGFFYALMPPDNAATVAGATAVSFSQDGAASGISRASAGEFYLPAVGVYEVSWQVTVDEPGQLVLWLNEVEQAFTVVGRATGTSQIANHVLIETSLANSRVSVRNPTGNSTALTMTPIAGGTKSVSASLLIKQIK